MTHHKSILCGNVDDVRTAPVEQYYIIRVGKEPATCKSGSRVGVGNLGGSDIASREAWHHPRSSVPP